MSELVLPLLLLVCVTIATIKKVNVYTAFTLGAKKSFNMALDMFPYLAGVLIVVELARSTGLEEVIINAFAPALNIVGIPRELTELITLRPFSGSASLALLKEIYSNYGVDSYISRCASVCYGSTETVLYVSAIYFANTSVKKT
ncbi:MAG: spore maturation protein, partial [Clostridia bacterium]